MSLENIEGEKWNDVPGYDGIYQASNFGRIKSCERIDCRGRLRPERIRKQTKTSKGILAIPLHLDADWPELAAPTMSGDCACHTSCSSMSG